MRIVPITVAIAMALVAAPAFANHHEGHAQTSGAVQVKDAGFMKTAAQASMAEVADGKLAAGRTQNAEVKAFAEMMVKDHGAALLELRAMAKQHNVGLPLGPDMKHQASSKAMEALQYGLFDKAYVARQVGDHKDTVALFEAQAKTGKIAVAKAWAAKMLPALKLHLKHAEELDAKLKK